MMKCDYFRDRCIAEQESSRPDVLELPTPQQANDTDPFPSNQSQ